MRRFLLGAVLWSMAAWAQPSGQPIDLSTLALGTELDRLLVSPDRLYVALGEGGVVVVDVSNPAAPSAVHRFAQDRRIIRLMRSGELLLLVEERAEVTAYAIRDLQAGAAMALALTPRTDPTRARTDEGAAAPAAPIAAATARLSGPFPVSRVEAGRVIIDAGRPHGFVPGAHVRVVSQKLVPKPDLTTGEIVNVPSGEVVAVVRVEHADDGRSMAVLGRGDFAETGDLASVTPEPLSERLAIPRRAPFSFQLGFHARPFIGLGSAAKPVGGVADVQFRYYVPGAPVAFGGDLTAAGLIGNSTSSSALGFAVDGAFSTDYFEIGLGLGGMGGTGSSIGQGVTFNQLARLGALDGLNLKLRSAILASSSSFSFGAARGEVNIPLTSRLGVFGGGGGGLNGYAYGDFGVRTYLGGAGASGTLILSASLGVAGVFGSLNGAGPTVAFGLETRQ